MSRLRRTSIAALALAVLLRGLGVPLPTLLPAEEEGTFCCAKGRCCCGDAPGTSDRPCLRRACGCDRPGPVAVHAPMRVEAVLPIVGRVLATHGSSARLAASAPRPVDRPDEPPVPPPRRPRPV